MPTPSNRSTTSTAILLVAHGSRDPVWVLPFERIRGALDQALGADRVGLAFLEFNQPSPAVEAERLVKAGCRVIALLPLFLGTGMHARKDMQTVLDALQRAHPGVEISLRPSLGETPAVLDAIVATGAAAAGASASNTAP